MDKVTAKYLRKWIADNWDDVFEERIFQEACFNRKSKVQLSDDPLECEEILKNAILEVLK